ncbi:hypothetical protein JY651_27150 [Pyxidicoccus parkwayensis]|uniref:Immunity MXAN-0049 protein domain-containing protein n=1 Tax=Pyxidicoccus parkwayensis TaxID=2813578 RepID=A0ABX7NJS4_9BACT|nr:DUF1629 domain-containing protein [Pyxidicoccus parkwaysis]QSQ19025.1 hypothetical protein JY651_27150 [Pyxidicoccus parkwaysis]
MASSNYVCWQNVPAGNSCVLSGVENLGREYELLKGIPRAGTFPDNVLFRMSDEYPKDVGLIDSLSNGDTLIIASRRLRDFLTQRQLPHMEYHRVTILNHKGRVASEDYHVVHPIHPQDCLDISASGCTYSPIVPTEIDFVDKLTIDESRVQPGVRMFRIKNFGGPVLVHRGFAEELSAMDFKGITFIELEQYGW